MPKKKMSMVGKGAVSNEPVPSLQESIISRVNADKTVSIVNLEVDDVCYTLDGIAAEVWTLIDGKTPTDQIKKSLLEKHNPPTIQFEEDFSKLLKKLQKENLISM